MLYLESNIKDHSWLKYLLDEFCRIEKAQFDFEITSAPPTGSNIVSYGKDSSDIFEATPDHFDSKIEYLNDDLFILKNTNNNSFKGKFKFDLLWNAFYFLSRKDEWDREKNGINIQSYSGKTTRNNNDSWLIPIVSNYFQMLKIFIEDKFDGIQFAPSDSPILELSHDLDYLKKTRSLKIKQGAFNFLNGLKNWDAEKLKRAISFSRTKQDYWNFDFWTNLEKKYALKSTFYVYSKTKNGGPKKWLLDPSYDVRYNSKLQDKLKELIEKGWKIGLHGSFDSASNFELLSEEKEILEKAIGSKVSKTRQHWLRYEEIRTPFYHEKLFEQDSTVGWNNRMGFRAGIASKYRPYNHREKRAFQHFVVPQIIMDSNIFDYGFENQDKLIQQSLKMLLRCRRVSNAHFSISWHPRTCNEEYNWHTAYEKLLKSW